MIVKPPPARPKSAAYDAIRRTTTQRDTLRAATLSGRKVSRGISLNVPAPDSSRAPVFVLPVSKRMGEFIFAPIGASIPSNSTAVHYRPAETDIDDGAGTSHDSPMNDMTRQELDAKFAAAEAKVDARPAHFDMSIKTGFSDMRAEFSAVRADLAKLQADVRTELAKMQADVRADLSNMQADVSKANTETIKWAIALAISVVVTTVGLLTLMNKVTERPAIVPAPVTISPPATPNAAAAAAPGASTATP